MRFSDEELKEVLKNKDLSVEKSRLKPHPLPAFAAAVNKRSKRNNEEEQLLTHIIELAHLYHWTVAHFRPARTEKGWRTAVSGDGKGFPDLVLVRANRIMAMELKSEKGKVSQEQWEWLEALGKTGAEVYLWKPNQIEEIAEVLNLNK